MFRQDTYSPSDTMLAGVALEHVVRVRIVLPKLLHYILAYIAVVLFDFGGDLHLVLRRDDSHLSTFAHQVKNELCDITTSYRNMLDRTADNITFRARYDVRYTISRVNDGSCQCTVCDAIGRPGSSEGKDSLYSNV